jgi:hypothetical protein
MSTALITVEEILSKAEKMLSVPRFNMLKAYIEKGGHPLAPDTASKFFELYLGGVEPEEIHRLNKAFPYEAIIWSALKFDWQTKRDEYIATLQDTVRDKVIKAQLETTGLLADMLTAANKHHGDKIKRYIMTGEAADLDGALNIDSITNLLKIVNGMRDITGQSNTQKIKTENTQTLNLNVKSDKNTGSMDAETAAEILAVIAKSKKKQDG